MSSFSTTGKARVPPAEQRWEGGGFTAESSHDGQRVKLHFSLWANGKRRNFFVSVDAMNFSRTSSRVIRKAVSLQRAGAANVESWLVKEVAGE